MAKDAKAERDDRLKAALKANMGRRKAQKRIRADDTHPQTPERSDPDEQERQDG